MNWPTWVSPDGSVTLIQGDALQVLPTLAPGSVDAVVTDPPYENMKGGVEIRGSGGVAPRIHESRTLANELGDAEGLKFARQVAAKGAVAFCSFHWVERCAELLGGTRKALISWYKRNSPFSTNNSPWYVTEYAWAVQYAPGIDWRTLRTHIDEPMLQAGCMASERICDDGKAVHPAQKPVAVMQAVLLPGMDFVLDPYRGLGTTAVACIRSGRKVVGIEREPRYFDIAVSRCQRELDRHPLFDKPKLVQQELIRDPSDAFHPDSPLFGSMVAPAAVVNGRIES